jgi:hypothetical protein
MDQQSQPGPVECLGQRFESDGARQKHFLDKLREKLRDPAFRNVPGFPKGTDEDILRMSDAPYYTACPNPFLPDFIQLYGKPFDPNQLYDCKPYAVDVSEGKTDPIYMAHAYHTKVPHKAIMRAILHYTEPGDLVLDGFAGTGMTGVAAQLCANPGPEFRMLLEEEWRAAGAGKPKWGARRAVLNDLSPAASFIAANYNLPFDVGAFATEAHRILDELRAEIGWMYETLHKDGKRKGTINYTVWSEVFTCPNCECDVVFTEEALDIKTGSTREEFPCPGCNKTLSKDNLDRQMETLLDPANGKPWRRIRLVPAWINYSVGGKVYQKKPSPEDLELLKKIAAMPLPSTVPTIRFPIEKMYHGSRLEPKGFTHINHLFLSRSVQTLGAAWLKARAVRDRRTRNSLLFFVEQALWTMSVLNRYRPTGYSQVNQYLTGVYYVASQHAEVSPWYALSGKLTRLQTALPGPSLRLADSILGTGDGAALDIPDDSVDYIFTDPPFGANIPYADLNLLIESWHRVLTNPTVEAIVDEPKGKDLAAYQHLMQKCFDRYYRVLKPGRWMTMVFHNSWNSVWAAIQEALRVAGFVVADVKTLDKQQGSYRQVTSMAMKQDLVVSAYKPNGGLEKRFPVEAGSEEGVWDFVRTHLRQLPSFIGTGERADAIAERQGYMLWDRMVAYHVLHEVSPPMSAAEFFAALPQHFIPRDGMYFLPEQVAEYDRKRAKATDVRQLELIVTNESSAVQWLRQQIERKPQTLQDLVPQFLREIAGWSKQERPVELADILRLNFLCFNGDGDVPSQIHAYLSTNWKDLRNRTKDDPVLRAAAMDLWYVPDPNKAADLEKLRERELLNEFRTYRDSSQKKLKLLRREAVLAGFTKAWEEKDWGTIVQVARKLPDSFLQEDPKLLMFFDLAATRLGVE